jgi:uncharacterized protein involved in exopolysaccharide biosynthesis
MSSTPQSIVTPGQFVSILARHPRRWLVPALAVTALSAVYALVRPSTWEASQALIVRNEAAGSDQSPGKFRHSEEMKTVQETILELVNSRDVLGAALAEVGPPANAKKHVAYPTAEDIHKLRKAVELVPPKGAEFGTTEIFYLEVQDHDRGRAAALATAIANGLTSRFQQLLDDRAGSMIRELERTVALAEADVEKSTTKLAELEQAVGTELAELRILHESPAGSSDLRQKVVKVDNELREARDDCRAKAELLSLLRHRERDPSELLALPNRLLDSHATLRRLIEGLTASRLNTCSLLGRMSKEHPLVRAAEVEEAEILRQVTKEWGNAVQIAQIEWRLADARVKSLEKQLDELSGRFKRLSGLRAHYANAVAQTQNHTALLETARRTLADARASQAAARAASLIDRVGLPDTGLYPVGPSRAVIMLVALAGGLLTGFGVLFLTVDLPADTRQLAAGAPISEPSWKRNGENGKLPSDSEPVGTLSLTQALAKIS